MGYVTVLTIFSESNLQEIHGIISETKKASIIDEITETDNELGCIVNSETKYGFNISYDDEINFTFDGLRYITEADIVKIKEVMQLFLPKFQGVNAKIMDGEGVYITDTYDDIIISQLIEHFESLIQN